MFAYRARLRENELQVVDGVLLTSPARTVLDVARHHPVLTSVPMIDYVLHERLASADELRDVLDFCRTWPGAPRARRAVRLSDSRAESPLESVSRLIIPRLKLPAPEPQVIILDEHDQQIARCDFYWDEFGVVGEADGLRKYSDPDGVVAQVVAAEKEREADLRDTELKVTRWTWRRVWSEQPQLRERLATSFRRGLARDRANIQRRWTAVSTDRIVVL